MCNNANSILNGILSFFFNALAKMQFLTI